MGRGVNTEAEGILYGAIVPRWIPPEADFQVELAVDVIGHFQGRTGKLVRLDVGSAEADIFVGDEYFDGAATVYVEDVRQVRDGLDALEHGVYGDDLRLHREDGPAVIYDRGDEEWWLHGRLHRPPDASGEHLPAITRVDGSRSWFVDGVPHREDGPAEIFREEDGSRLKKWSQYGVLHREDGPAVEHEGMMTVNDEYWLRGEEYFSRPDWKRAVKTGT